MPEQQKGHRTKGRVRTSIDLYPSEIAELDAVACEHGVKRVQMIRTLIQNARYYTLRPIQRMSADVPDAD